MEQASVLVIKKNLLSVHKLSFMITEWV